MTKINTTEEEKQDRTVWRSEKSSRLQVALAVSKYIRPATHYQYQVDLIRSACQVYLIDIKANQRYNNSLVEELCSSTCPKG
jgi:hypothetical protein